MASSVSKFRPVESASLDKRRVQRHPVLVRRATVRRHARNPSEASLVDISVYGCRLSIDGSYQEGDRLWLRFAGGNPIAATVVWFDGTQMGCRFDEPLDKMVFRALTLVLD
jgi:hypothetical protein